MFNENKKAASLRLFISLITKPVLSFVFHVLNFKTNFLS